MAEVSPPYTSRSNPTSLQSSKPNQISITFKPPNFSILQGTYRFPKDFGIYHASRSHSNMVIAQKADDPQPLLYISTHGALSSKPNIAIHSTANENSPPLATADFKLFPRSVDIFLLTPECVSRYPTGGAALQKLKTDGTFSRVMVFNFTLSGSTIAERFEWKNSSGKEVRSLEGRSHGKKLVRVKTGEVVCVWASPNTRMRKKGKMAFLGKGHGLGEGFELMVVITMLAIMERTRRSSSSGGGGD